MLVIDIIDASNLERSLYLATQFREIDSKVLFALNMADLASSHGTKIDAEKLSNLLDVPVVFTVGNKNEGIDNLLKEAIKLAESDPDEKGKPKCEIQQGYRECDFKDSKHLLKKKPKTRLTTRADGRQ